MFTLIGDTGGMVKSIKQVHSVRGYRWSAFFRKAVPIIACFHGDTDIFFPPWWESENSQPLCYPSKPSAWHQNSLALFLSGWQSHANAGILSLLIFFSVLSHFPGCVLSLSNTRCLFPPSPSLQFLSGSSTFSPFFAWLTDMLLLAELLVFTQQ